MRFAIYAGSSVALALAVIVKALHERANSFSACVYLAQSNACIMILTNVLLLAVSVAMLGLQRLLYGPLRPIEVEQLYEKAWFAITETCLAMTIFREDVGARFLFMFVSLLFGKVWGWIGDGRVELLEQQPPSNPRLFHARVSSSLVLSLFFDCAMLYYSVDFVLQHPRPNMMIMFAFEFAVLLATSFSTAARYLISLREAAIIQQQIKERKAQFVSDREQASLLLARRNNDPASVPSPSTIRAEVNAMEIDVPGWEEKGRWVFYMELFFDFLKLTLYLTFFCVLCMFYGMPIHIIRDVALTLRSFHKRLSDFIRYRQATRDMNERYPDATPEEVSREDCCIICRESMVAWQADNTTDLAGNHANQRGGSSRALEERQRPKKLPCGHVLHFACLRSWLERQQICPTCRAPVLRPTPTSQNAAPSAPQRARNNLFRNADRNGPARDPRGQAVPGNVAENVFQLGPLRIAFGAGRAQGNAPNPDAQNNVAPSAHTNAFTTGPRAAPNTAQNQLSNANSDGSASSSELDHLEYRILRDIEALQLQSDQLGIVRSLQNELQRLRSLQARSASGDLLGRFGPRNNHTFPSPLEASFRAPSAPQGAEGASAPALDAESPNLPPGLTLPTGWSLLPLERLPVGGAFDGSSQPPVQAALGAGNVSGAARQALLDEVSSHSRPDPNAADPQGSVAINQST